MMEARSLFLKKGFSILTVFSKSGFFVGVCVCVRSNSKDTKFIQFHVFGIQSTQWSMKYGVLQVAVFIVPFDIRQSSLQASAYDIQRNDVAILKKSTSCILNNT